MKGLFTGIAAFFVGIGSFFHGGTPVKQQQKNPNVTIAISPPINIISGMPPARPSGKPPASSPSGEIKKMEMGIITAVTDTSITMTDMRKKSIIITVNDSTIYKNGSKSDLAANVKVAVKLKKTTDSTKIAESIEINPTVPTGKPHQGQKGPQGNDGQRPPEGGNAPQ